MTERGAVAFGNARITYAVVRSPRRHKTVEITVERPGEIVVAAPVGTPRKRLEAIVRRRAGWIVRRSGAATHVAPTRRFVSGEALPYLGREVRLSVREARAAAVEVRFSHWRFDVIVPSGLRGEARRAAVATAFERWFRDRAEQWLRQRAHQLAARLGVRPSGILVRDQRQRWGSCSPEGILRFNWRIVMAPPAIVDYVIIHELAHLQVRSHRPEYWALVARAAPDYRERRERLRAVGPSLVFLGAA